MKRTKTNRGFGLIEFKDRYGAKCSIQKSSLATEDAIWFGIDDPELVVFENETKGKYITTKIPDNFSVNCRMHLTQEQVKDIIPILQKFVKTGEI